MRSFYLSGDMETRSLIFAPVHLHIGQITLDKAGKKELNRLAELDYEEIADYVMSKEPRAINLVLGKIAIFDEANRTEWANKAWIPSTDKIVEFPEVDEWELQQAFRDWAEREKKRKVKEKEELLKKDKKRTANRLKPNTLSPRTEMEAEEESEVVKALRKLSRLRHK